MTVSTEVSQARNDPTTVLWALAGGCWLLMVGLLFVPGGHLTHAAHVVHGLQHSMLPWPVVVAVFAGGWLLMVGGMMLPAITPMARMFTVVSARQPRPTEARAAFFGAYFAVWLAFAVVALAADIALHELVVQRWEWLQARQGLLLAGALALAGAFQLSWLKDRCMTVCREPAGFLWTHYRRGAAGAWAMGIRHGLACLGCCWALMTIMFFTGIADLAWMAGLTVVMVAEKVTRWGHRLAVPVGIGLLLAAAVLATGEIGPWAGGAETPMHLNGHPR